MAGKQWSKVWRDVGLSRRLANLMARDPVSYGLYWHLKALADDFGRYPNDPERFLMEGAQRMLLNGAITALNGVQCLSNCVELGIARVYEVDGVEYLELLDFHTHENPNWGAVSSPEYPAPPDWTPPESLVEFLLANHGKRNITPKRYGITPDNAPEALKEWARAGIEPRSTGVKPRSSKTAKTRTDIEPRSENPAENERGSIPARATDQTRPDSSSSNSSPSPASALPAPDAGNDGNGQEEELCGEGPATANGHGPATAHGNGADVDAAIAALAAACRTRTNHPGIRATVEDQLAQGRDPAFLRHTAIITQTEFADNPKATPGRVAAYFATCCSNGAPAWERNKPDPWERINGPCPRNDPARAIYLSEKQMWGEGRRPAQGRQTKYKFPEEPS